MSGVKPSLFGASLSLVRCRLLFFLKTINTHAAAKAISHWLPVTQDAGKLTEALVAYENAARLSPDLEDAQVAIENIRAFISERSEPGVP